MQKVTSNNEKKLLNIDRKSRQIETSFHDLKLEINVLIKLLFTTGSNNDNTNEIDDRQTLSKILKHIDQATGFASIPDILKVLVLFENDLIKLYEMKTNEEIKQTLADILSYTYTGSQIQQDNSVDNKNIGKIVKYYLLGTKANLLQKFGMTFVRNLVKDLLNIWKNLNDNNIKENFDRNSLIILIKQCAEYFLEQNSEIEACDLLLESSQLIMLESLSMIDDRDLCFKICHYLIATSQYICDDDDHDDHNECENILYTTLSLYLKHYLYIDALIIAILLQNRQLIVKIFSLCMNQSIRQQMALILAKHNLSFINMDEDYSYQLDSLINNDQSIKDALSNRRLNQLFMIVAKQFDLLKPKVPNDIANKDVKRKKVGLKKLPLLPTYNRQSILGTSFMNCFLNAAFSSDKLIFSGTDWIGRHKQLNRMTATATIGIICLWDIQNGLLKIDRYLRSKDEHIKAGALIAFGLINTTIKCEYDSTYQLLKDYISNRSKSIRIGSIIGLAIAYLGTNRYDVIKSILNPYINDDKKSDQSSTENSHNRNRQLLPITALACGLIAHSTGNISVIETLINLIEKNIDKMKIADPNTRDLIHSIGLITLFRRNDLSKFLDLINRKFFDEKETNEKNSSSSTTTMITPEIRTSIKKYLSLWAEICAYTGSSNILKIQKFIRNCSPIIMDDMDKKKVVESNDRKNDDDDKCKKMEKDKEKNDKKDKKKDDTTSSLANTNSTIINTTITDNELIQMLSIIGIGLVSIGDHLNGEMVLQTFIKFLRFGNNHIKSSVIIAIALTHLSNPKMNIIELLYKFCHYSDDKVALNAIFALGFVSAGTNNARVSKMFQELEITNRDKVNYLFAIKFSQGLLYLGKGLLTLSPQMEIQQLLRHSSLASILTFVLRLLVDPINDLIQQHHYYLLFIAGCMRPKFLITIDNEWKSVPISVRVGQSIDTIGMAGCKPIGITAYNTFETPVLLQHGEKAELATTSSSAENVTLYRPLTTNYLDGIVIVEKNNDNVEQ